MEYLGNFRSDDSKCRGCWLRECCKLVRGEKEQRALDAIHCVGLVFLHFDGERLTEMKAGYDRNIIEFLEVA